MSNTLRTWRKVRDKSPKKKKDRKSFVFSGEGYFTKALGGPGNKRGWKQPMSLYHGSYE